MHLVKSNLRVLAGSLLATGALVCGSAHASVLWDGAASNGTGVFSSLNIENNPGQINVVTDSTYGKVFQFICYDNGNTKVRTEGSHMANFQPLPGNTYYFGWRHKWGPLPTLCGKWQVLEQIHLAGTGATGGPVPFGLHVDGCDTNMHFQYQDASGTPHDFLVLPFPLNSWHTFVYHEKWSESETDGYVEFWFDGTMQTLTNGTTRYPSAWCFPNSTSYWKWGVYRSGSGGPIGTSYAYLSAAKAGTTYADVAPVPIGTTVDFEAESLAYTTSGPTVTTQSDTNASGGVITYFNATGSSQWVEFATGTIKAGTYSLAYEYKQNGNRGQHTITIDGTQVGGTVDEYSSSSGYTTKTIGTVNFTTTGTHKIRLNVTGKNASASGYVLAPDAFDFNAQ